MTIRERIASFLFGDIIEKRLAAVSIAIDDSAGWDSHTARPQDRPWADRAADLEDGLTAWRLNFMIRRTVALIRSYVVGGGLTVSSTVPAVDTFIRLFWAHPQNRIDRRLGALCDEFTRAGEIFPILFTNKIDGMSYLRFIPASQIREVTTHAEDYETEISFTQITATGIEKTWIGPGEASAFVVGDDGSLPPLMLHLAVNRPIGATRGEGDLTPILPWARRYSEWLKDRVRLNRQRTRFGLLDVTIADDSLVDTKKQQLRGNNPLEAGIYVHGPGEETKLHDLKIMATDAAEDGQTLRLAIATGANAALHYFGEGEAVNYSTAKEMGEPTARFFAERQQAIADALIEIITFAWKRREIVLGVSPSVTDLNLSYAAAEVARADNESLATAAKDAVTALAQMRAFGWIDQRTAAALAFKFAGEPLSEEELDRILEKAEPVPAGVGLPEARADRPAKKGTDGDE